MSGRIYARTIPDWRERGFRVKLIYLSLKDIQIALERVRVRLRQDVPEEVIRRCYERGWRNFNTVYKAIVDSWVLYDNSGDQPVLLDTGGHR